MTERTNTTHRPAFCEHSKAWSRFFAKRRPTINMTIIAAKSALPDGVQDLLLNYQMKELMPENQFTKLTA